MKKQYQQKVDLTYPASTTLGNMNFSSSAGIDIVDEIHRCCKKERKFDFLV